MIDSKLAVIILAAGSSSRLGQPKQLLEYKSSTLIEHTVECARSVSNNVKVIIGSSAKSIEDKLDESKVEVLVNHSWHEGIGNSIAFGTKKLLESEPLTSGILFLLSDQPHISIELLSKIIKEHNSKDCTITACIYAGNPGVPAIFDSVHFDELSNLKGDRGAKLIINKYPNQTELIDFPEGKIDIDTERDLKHLD